MHRIKGRQIKYRCLTFENVVQSSVLVLSEEQPKRAVDIEPAVTVFALSNRSYLGVSLLFWSSGML